MRKLGLTLAAAFAATVAAAPALATTVTVSSASTTSINGASNFVQDFSGFKAGDAVGVNAYVYNGAVPDKGAVPGGSASGNYLAVLGGGNYTYTLPAFAPVLSFIAGSVDSYNSVTLSLYNTLSKATTYEVFTGSQFGTGSERLTFDTGSATNLISAATFYSGSNSFEIDNIVSAAPEPATWAMMILGFGFAGMGLRASRRSRGKLALA